ncbi:D-xylose-binding periplasmic protein [Thermoflexales bacterium]|nr:D-xylose-binding periplasmic protein [Thermoflexales bacterium]
MKRWWLIVLCSSLWLAGCTGAATPTPILHPQPALFTDRLGTAQDLIPTETEIAAAKTALGVKGFIGIVACNLSSEYHATVPRAAQALAHKLGLRIEVFDSETKADRQIAAIENFVSKGAPAIAICAIDPKVVEKAVKEAAGQGVYVLQYAGRDLAVNGIGISIEDADLGCAAGEIAADLIVKEKRGQALVVLLDYPSLPNVVERANQIEACLKQKAPGVKIVGRYLGGTPENGLTSLENALQAHPAIDVVVSINDAGAFGAIKALEAAGKDPQTTIVVGIDADAQAKDLIKQGKFFRGTVDTSPALTGEMVVNAVIKLLAGSTAPKNVRVPVAKITRDLLP